jgi:hypothetical protein
VAEVAANVDSDVESVERRSSRGSEDGGEDAVALPRPLATVVARDRSRSNSPAISNVKDDSFLTFFMPSNSFETTKNFVSTKTNKLGKFIQIDLLFVGSYLCSVLKQLIRKMFALIFVTKNKHMRHWRM